ncbi:hypothetical protein [Vagococcus intermedius]|uniref:Uncharacterized protein n=1 Tax=Vagococcus intermedius TaxID=2991418 RepID=A0AAF0CTW9_9ENTE|nr:hypothetical protein [Vagococcus intermedius]WEG72776.1 hypothetical protein OL234_07235 [Vagococcus intermedius]WEG74861.1 hypothetical protein OL235_07230 [Vagococcus intermedius]
MAVLTEYDVRKMLTAQSLSEIELIKGTIITPSASSFLKEKHITVNFVTEINDTTIEEPTVCQTMAPSVVTEEVVEKPTRSASLKSYYEVAALDVFKSKLGVFHSELQVMQVMLAEEEQEVLLSGLETVHHVLVDVQEALATHTIFESEVLFEEIEEDHRLKTYTYDMGKIVIYFNRLACLAEELKVLSYQTFCDASGQTSQPVLLNALSKLPTYLRELIDVK